MNRHEPRAHLGMGAVGLSPLAEREALAASPHPHHHDPTRGNCLKTHRGAAVDGGDYKHQAG
jgi:hypothetical protein